MSYVVAVNFGQGRDYEFHIHESDVTALEHRAARDWLVEEFERLECEPRNPVGKLLILDVILDVAKYRGEKHFAARDAWAEDYVRRVAAVLERPVISVDVANLKVG